MKKLQKYVLHPLTALIMAFAVAQFMSHYQIVEFHLAAELSFIIVFIGYLFLSRKYDPSLTFIFLGVALFMGYKAMGIPGHTTTAQAPTDQILVQKLSSLVALVKFDEIQKGQLPSSLEGLKMPLIETKDFQFQYCRQDDSCSRSLGQSSFYIIANKATKGDREKSWYIDDKFVITKKNQMGDNVRIFP